jgi:hypothetical protein
MVCKPKQKGGLGIVNFQKQNTALLIKFLDKFYNHADLPWVNLIWYAHYEDKIPHAENLCGSFWWRDVLKLVDNFRGVSSVKPGRGNTFLFWSDSWEINGSSRPLKDRYPRLFSFVLNENMSAAQVYDQGDFSSLFYRPLSIEAYGEFQELQEIMRSSPLSLEPDVWGYVWGERYTAASFYTHIHAHIQTPRVYKWLWKSCCIMSHKTFAWLLLVDRLNTRDMLHRRHWNTIDDKHCELCPLRAHEDRIHLFFQCNFSSRVWNYLQIDWIQNDDLQVVISNARQSFGKPFFMEVLILACRGIWLVQNDKIFNQVRPYFH